MSRTAIRILLLSLGALLALPGRPGSAWADAGKVEIRLTDHRPGVGDFSTLRVELAEVSVHPAGQPKGTGWVEVVHRAPAIDIVPLKNGQSARVGSVLLRAGGYDAVRVRFGQIHGTLRNGGPPEVAPFGATVLADLIVEPGATRVVIIDLYVEDQSDHRPGQYALKIRAVRVAGNVNPRPRSGG